MDPLPIYKRHESGLTCSHASQGLCPQCQGSYDEDYSAYMEFGDHAQGQARWRRLEAEIAADAADFFRDIPDDAGGIPF